MTHVYEFTDEMMAKAQKFADDLGLPHSPMPPTAAGAALRSIALAAMLEGCPECHCSVCVAVRRIVPEWTEASAGPDLGGRLPMSTERLSFVVLAITAVVFAVLALAGAMLWGRG